MKPSFVCAMVLAFVLSACCAGKKDVSSIDLSDLQEIQVGYRHMGWGSIEEDFTIMPRPGGDFVLRGHYMAGRHRQRSVDQRLPAGAVGKFVEALASTPWPRDKAMHALVERIDRRALTTFEPVQRMPASRCHDDELAMLAKRHLGRAGLMELVGEHYQHRINWTDDYPVVMVRVEWRDRPAIIMSSQAQQTPMLPWDRGVPVDSPSEAGENWSLPLSTSLQALLPADSRIHARLDGGSSLERRLNRIAMHRAESVCRDMRPTPPASGDRLTGTPTG